MRVVKTIVLSVGDVNMRGMRAYTAERASIAGMVAYGRQKV